MRHELGEEAVLAAIAVAGDAGSILHGSVDHGEELGTGAA